MKESHIAGDLVVLGRIGAVHGIKGWVKISSFTQPIENIFEYRHFLLKQDAENEDGDNNEWQQVELDQFKKQGKGIVGHVRGCDDRELARAYNGAELAIPRCELPALDEAEYYWHQLQGLQVFTDKGEFLGEVDYLIETGANDVLVVKAVEESIDSRERLIPYLPDQVVNKVDLQNGKIEVCWDPHFLE